MRTHQRGPCRPWTPDDEHPWHAIWRTLWPMWLLLIGIGALLSAGCQTVPIVGVAERARDGHVVAIKPCTLKIVTIPLVWQYFSVSCPDGQAPVTGLRQQDDVPHS